jgi:hypothetical protein
MSAFFRSASKDYMRSLVIGLIAAAIGLPLGCVCVLIPLGIVTTSDQASIWILIVPMAAFLFLLFGGGIAVAGFSLYRRKSRLDSVFAPLGLTGSLYMLNGRQYRGDAQGRQVDVRFYRGPTLEIYVSTSVQTRAGMAERSALGTALAGFFNRTPLQLDDPALSGLDVYALDEGWTRLLLAQPEARAALLRLMQASNWAALHQVHLQPGAFQLRLYRNRNLFQYDISPEEGRQWLEDLMTLARVAESLPAPQVTAQASSAEQMVRSGGLGKVVLPITIAMVVALLVGIPLCGIAITMAILALAK